jgi:hypothetical protein
MSSTTNTPYMTKSMNGIIVLSDGAGTVIENGTITTDNLDLVNLNVDNIKGIADGDNINLYTATTGDIQIGSLSTSSININADELNLTSATTTTIYSANISFNNTNNFRINSSNISSVATRDNYISATRYASLIGLNQVFINTNSTSTGTVAIEAGSAVSINNGNGKPTNIGLLRINGGTLSVNGTTDIYLQPATTTGRIRISGAQDIEPVAPLNGLIIGENITGTGLFLGNSNFPPSSYGNASTAYQLVNYQTALTLLSGGSVLGSNNVWSGTNEFNNDVSFNGTNTRITGTTTISGLTNINQGGTLGTTINTAGNTGTIIIGNVSTPTNTISGNAVNINNSVNGNVNIASVLNTTSTITIGNNSANCTLNIGRQMTPTYTYTDANGANVATAIGYYNESVNFTAQTINATTTGMLNFSIPDDGVWCIIFSVRVESNTTSASSVTRLAIGLGTASTNFDYCEFWSGTAVVSGTTAPTKTYLAPICTHIDRFTTGQGVWVNALGNGNNGIRALIKSAKWTRLA